MLDRVTQIATPLGETIDFAYANNTTDREYTVTVADSAGSTHYRYDGAGRLLEIAYPDPDGPAGPKTAQSVKYTYDKNKNLTGIEDQLHNITVFKYDGRNRLTHIYEANPLTGQAVNGSGNPLGPVTQFTYTLAGELKTVTDPMLRVTTFDYDPLGRLSKQTDADPDGPGGPLAPPVTEYEYDLAGRLLRVIAPDPDGAGGPLERPTTDYVYDFAGRVTGVYHPDPDGAASPLPRPFESFAYDAMGNVTAYTDARGFTTDYEYDLLGQLVLIRQPKAFPTDVARPETRFAYDPTGRLARVTDALGRVTQYAYDAASNLLAEIDALGGVRSYQYDQRGLMTAEIDPLGHATRYAYDNLGRLVSTTRPDPDGFGGAQLAPVVHYDYDDANNLISVSDPRSDAIRTEYAYDRLHRLTTITSPLPLPGDPARPVTSYSYYADGQIETETDPLGRLRRYSYDGLGRLIGVNDWSATTLGDANGPLTSYGYDGLSRLTSITLPDPDGPAGPLGRPVTTFSYDALGRRTAVIEADPDGDPNAGASSPVTQFFYDAVGNLAKTVDPVGAATLYTYDALNRRITSKNANHHTTSYHYDLVGNLVATADPHTGDILGGFRTVRGYDALDRLVLEADQRNGATRYAYDAAGRMTSLTDPRFNTTRFEYDDLDRLTRDTDPLGHSRLYAYDDAGNRVQETDRNGRVRAFEFDQLNRQVAEHWLDASQATIRQLAWQYDLAGQLTGASDPSAAYAYQYDLAGRATQSTVMLAGLGHDVRLEQTFDQLNRRLSLEGVLVGVATPGARNDYQYDALGRMTQVVQSTPGGASPDRRVDFNYWANGQLSKITRATVAELPGGGQTVTVAAASDYYYTPTGQLALLLHFKGDQSLLGLQTWTYDFNGRLYTATSSNPLDGSVTYQYDGAGQLVSANYSTSQADESYIHDLAGNRAFGGYQTGPGNQLLSDGTFRYEYDAEGNRTLKERLSTDPADDFRVEYQWDHRQRLVAVTFKNNNGDVTKTVHYEYDLFDRLVARTVDADGELGSMPAVKTFNVYDDDDVFLEFVDDDASTPGDAVLSKRYLHGPLVDQVLAEQDAATDAIRFYLTDNLGSLRDLIDPSGNVVEHVRYDAYGNIQGVTDGSGNPLEGPSTRYTYTGREWDDAVDMYFYRARWYDPAVGRFLNPDPSGFIDGPNLYAYVSNSPTKYTDPTGKQAAQASVIAPLPIIPGGGAANAAAGAIQNAIGSQAAIGTAVVAGNLAGTHARHAIMLRARMGARNRAIVDQLNRAVKNGEICADDARRIADKLQALPSTSETYVGNASALRQRFGLVSPWDFAKGDYLTRRDAAWRVQYEIDLARLSQLAASKGITIHWPSVPHRNKSEGHWETIRDKVQELIDSGLYDEIWVNQGLGQVKPGIDPNRRPDIYGRRKKDGKIDQFEVPSNSDRIAELEDRMEDSRRLLGDLGGDCQVVPRRLPQSPKGR